MLMLNMYIFYRAKKLKKKKYQKTIKKFLNREQISLS